ncbi:MAG TPA: C2 family cysteine protease, partial [Myxococcota bacterium]
NGAERDFPLAQVHKIVFTGSARNDSFTNNTSIPCVANGGDGDDVLTGGSGADTLNGQGGNDTIKGGDGDDVITGGDGDDVLYGNQGDDEIHGNNGNDRIYGGRGSNTLYGDAGSDTIVAVNGAHDTRTGGTGEDFIWMDASDTLTDVSSTETQNGDVHSVSSFLPYRYVYADGSVATVSIDKVLDGPNLGVPQPVYANETTMDVSSQPLFASTGPSADDIVQGESGDCYILAPLSTDADAQPDDIRRVVVDLDDGTYAVRFFKNNVPVYERVDGQLWMRSGKPANAGFGVEGSIWVPIVEKAYAFFRLNDASYISVANSSGFTADWKATVSYVLADDDSENRSAQVIAWVNAGSPASDPMAARIHNGVAALYQFIDAQQALGNGLYAGATAEYGNNEAFDPTLWRRAEHLFMIDHVIRDSSGTAIGIDYRNPWGTDNPVTSETAIYFFSGLAAVWSM